MIIKPFINIQVADRLISYRQEEEGIVMRSRTKNEPSKIIAIFKRSKNGINKQVDRHSEASY